MGNIYLEWPNHNHSAESIELVCGPGSLVACRTHDIDLQLDWKSVFEQALIIAINLMCIVNKVLQCNSVASM